MTTKQQAVLPFKASYYGNELRENINSLVMSTITAHELQSQEVPKEHFRNCLAGDEKKCATTWKAWMEKGIIENSNIESYFISKYQFTYEKKSYERWSLFAAIDLKKSEILEHESVFNHVVEDTKNRTIACKVDLTPIYIGIDEQYFQAWKDLITSLSDKFEKFMSYTEKDSSKHELYKINDTELFKKIYNFFSNKTFYLLDGHHRLIAAKENLKNNIGDGKILSCISTMNEKELVVTPIHRSVVEYSWINSEAAIKELENEGCVIKKTMLWDLNKIHKLIEQLEETQFYFLPAQRTTLYLVEVKNEKEDLIVDTVEKIFSSIEKSIALLPAEKITSLMSDLANGQAQAALFLPNISLKNIRERAKAGKYLPRKSTKFLPKPAIGLVARNWEN